MRALTARRAGPLRGTWQPPGDKSISHRALILGLLGVGQTTISGLFEGPDVRTTAAACRALGARIERFGPGLWRVDGAGLGTLIQPRAPLGFGSDGTGARLMMGLVAGHAITATFEADASLRKRPMRRILDPLTLMGAQVLAEAENGRLPVVLKGVSEPAPIEYTTPVPSAQLKSAILLAGLNSPGRTTIIEAEASRDHTERMLAWFGASITIEAQGEQGRRIALEGRPTLRLQDVAVPADPSLAAFPLVAALLVPGSLITLTGVMMNPLRTGLIDTLLEMGADIAILDRRIEGCEEVADLRVRHSPLKGVNVNAARTPSMIDEYPILAVAAAFASGETRMRGLAEPRMKESGRLAAIAAGLTAAGVENAVEAGDLVVRGTGLPHGGAVIATHLDHRVAMSFLIMGLASERSVTIDDETMIATIHPSFKQAMAALGAEFG